MNTVDQTVIDAARTTERDRYLSALLAPPEARADLVVLAAYLGEIRRIPLLAHDVSVGEIRLQWWRDALGAEGPASGHPVADAVADLVRRRGLDRDLVLAPVEGASRELYEDGFADDEDLERYAAETDGAALRVALSLLGRDDAMPGVVPAGRALALTRLALTLPQHLALGRLPLPPAYLRGLRDPRGAAPEEARSVTRVLLTRLSEEASQALGVFREDEAGLDAAARAAFLPLALVEPYAKSILAPRRDVLRDVADISPLSRVMRLWFARVLGRA